jgi:hypothetical protein
MPNTILGGGFTVPTASVTISTTASYTTANVTTSSHFAYTTTSSLGNVLISNGAYYTSHPALQVSGDATFEGDLKWKGRSLGDLLQSIEDRLAVLATPDPAKLEKFAALKKAYDHYKLMEKLIGDD